MTDWVLDPERAALAVRLQPRPVDCAMHHFRCCYVNDEGQRCRLADGHMGEHQPPADKQPERAA